MSEQHEYECMRCKIVVTAGGGSYPDKKAGGPCPKASDGKHGWNKKE